jgi:hypothetical protein
MANDRRSVRLRGYDYSQPGAYFVPICTQGRACLFCAVVDDGIMHMNDAGRMVERWLSEVTAKYPVMALDQFVIMPNHVHAIIPIVGAALCGRPDRDPEDGGRPHRGAPTSRWIPARQGLFFRA